MCNTVSNKDFTTNLLMKIIDKYENSKVPIRAVMIRSNFCYICNSNKENIFFLKEDSYFGLYSNYGWLYCDKCKKLVDLIQQYFYNNVSYIRYSKVKIFENHSLSFLRVSSNKEIKPYIQKNSYYNPCEGNFLNIFNNNKRISVTITWNQSEFSKLVKIIPLSNLIFYNRKVFGYKMLDFPIKNLSKKWLDLLKKEYDYSNKFFLFLLILNRNKKFISQDLLKIIFDFSNDLHVF